MSEIISIPILELMEKTEQWLLNQGYKKNTLGVYKAMFVECVAVRFLAGIGEDDFIDLPDELVEQFAEQFRQPEVFVNVGGRIIAYPVAEEPVQDGMSY